MRIFTPGTWADNLGHWSERESNQHNIRNKVDIWSIQLHTATINMEKLLNITVCNVNYRTMISRTRNTLRGDQAIFVYS